MGEERSKEATCGAYARGSARNVNVKSVRGTLGRMDMEGGGWRRNGSVAKGGVGIAPDVTFKKWLDTTHPAVGGVGRLLGVFWVGGSSDLEILGEGRDSKIEEANVKCLSLPGNVCLARGGIRF